MLNDDGQDQLEHKIVVSQLASFWAKGRERQTQNGELSKKRVCLSSEFVGEVEHQESQISGEGGPVGLLQWITRLKCGDDAGKGVVDQTCIVEEDVHEQAKVTCHCGEVRLKDLALLTYTVDAGLCDWIDKLNESCDSLTNCTPGTGFQLSSE